MGGPDVSLVSFFLPSHSEDKMQGKTKAGDQCRDNAIPGTDFCMGAAYRKQALIRPQPAADGQRAVYNVDVCLLRGVGGVDGGADDA